MEDEKYFELVNLFDYVDHFNIHFGLLLRRYKRFGQINKLNNKDIDVITYLDMIVVQLRAMCIERQNNSNNYTAQILLRKLGEFELAQKIDDMLAENFIDGLSIKNAIKTLADKFICHYDNFDGKDIHLLSLADIIEIQLKNPYQKKNLNYIMQVLIDCIGEGLTIKMDDES